jgi:hypothetical protein
LSVALVMVMMLERLDFTSGPQGFGHMAFWLCLK